MEVLHNLPSTSDEFTNQWLEGQRSAAAGVVSSSIATFDYAVAGFAIHKLQDSFAHQDAAGGPRPLPDGHKRDSILSWISGLLGVHRVFRDPDNIFDHPERSRQSAEALALAVARGLDPNVLPERAVQVGTSTWSRLFGVVPRNDGHSQEIFNLLAQDYMQRAGFDRVRGIDNTDRELRADAPTLLLGNDRGSEYGVLHRFQRALAFVLPSWNQCRSTIGTST